MGSMKDLRATGNLLPASTAGKSEIPAGCRGGDGCLSCGVRREVTRWSVGVEIQEEGMLCLR